MALLGVCRCAPWERHLGTGHTRALLLGSRPPSKLRLVSGARGRGAGVGTAATASSRKSGWWGRAQAAWELGAAVHMAACHGQRAPQEVLCVPVCVRACARCELCMRVKWGPWRAGLLRGLQTCPRHGEGLALV